jgi:putative hemolysin
MLSRFKVVSQPAGGFKAPLRLARKLVPVFKAYSGIRIADRTKSRTATLGRLGALEVRLARTAAEVRRAQKLRYDVFYREMSAVADTALFFAQRDIDLFDAVCDHLLVIDHGAQPLRKAPAIVGTYRLLRQDIAERSGGFYSAGEFDVNSLVARHRDLKFLELGRSCVLPPYRNKRTVELLWHGIWTYVLEHHIEVMIGCASLDGTDPDRLALPLSFLHHFARAPEAWRTAALPERSVDMDRMSKDVIAPKAALQMLPPLIKGYLRLGAFVGDGAVVDRQFGTTDVLIILPVSDIQARYLAHFGPGAERHAA